MIALLLTVIWLGLIGLGLGGIAALERRSRVSGLDARPDLVPPRRDWGGAPEHPPARWVAARSLAALSRMVRARSAVEGGALRPRRAVLLLSLIATASALSLLPPTQTWGAAPDGRSLVAVDIGTGLVLLVFLILLSGLAQAASGLAEQNVWARLGAVGVTGRSLVGVALLLLVLAPLTLATGSLRLQELVRIQQESFVPFSALLEALGPADGEGPAVDARLPGWFLFRQPLTAILFVPALVGLLRRPLVWEPTGGCPRASGFGIDADPTDLYWARLDARLATLLASALFVTLFLGAGGLPFVDGRAAMGWVAGRLGEPFAAFVLFVVELSTFVVKVGLVLVVGSALRRATAPGRVDQMLQVATRRLFPLAWANLLLLAALSLVARAASEGLP